MTAIEINESMTPAGSEGGRSKIDKYKGKVCFFFQLLQGVNKHLFRDGIIILLAQLALLAGLLIAEKEIILDPVLQIFLIFYASYTGWALFEKERQDGAVEYMLSLPVSRSRLFFIKFIPRAVVVIIVLAFYLLLQHLFDFPFILDKLSFSITYLVFFLVSIAFSLGIKSFITVFLLTSLLSLGQAFYIKILSPTLSDSEALLRANLTILVFPLLFFVIFQFYDIKPLSYFNRKFAPPAFIIAAIILAVIHFTAEGTWHIYTLTKSGSVIRNKCSKTDILKKQEGKLKRFKYKGCVFPLREIEEKNLLYAVRRTTQKNVCVLSSLVSVDLKTGRERQLFEVTQGWDVAGWFPGKIGKIVDETYYLILQSTQRQVQMILAINGEDVKQVPISGDLHGQYIEEFFHVVNSPRQFFLIDKSSMVYRVDESGVSERLFQAEALAAWKEKLLVFDSSGMTLYNCIEDLTPIYKKEGETVKVLRQSGTHETRLVILKIDKRYYMLDLEKENEPVQVKFDYPPFYYEVLEDKYILFHRLPQEIIISEIKNGKIIEREKWYPQIEFDYGQIYISSSGILVYNEKEYEVYEFKK